MNGEDPEKTIRGVLDACADCEVCRDMMETCLFFPELYRLRDQEKETGEPATDRFVQLLRPLLLRGHPVEIIAQAIGEA